METKDLPADAQNAIAYLLGRGDAMESALRVLIGTHSPRSEWPNLVRIQLDYSVQYVAPNAQGLLDQDHQAAAVKAFADMKGHIVRGLSNGKFVPPRAPAADSMRRPKKP